MKKIFFFTLVFSLAHIVKAQHTEQVKDITKYVEFTNAVYDFGKIPFGKPVEYNVTIKNISNEPIWVNEVSVGCGCTTPKFEKGKKYDSGETFTVTLGFNANTMGAFSKYATIYFNNNAFNKQVTFHGETYTVQATAPANSALEKIKPAGN
ncbi:MAG: DUF1573 domain-containing protein [Bacteroidetes bacterium]|nr:DUF1573 domain-containing protein [Bacteroidota bacterium]MBS1649239.1 DUF1573 domain-containing protein [Bacteroidota bacterium]